MLDEIDDVGSGSGMLPPPSLPPPSSPPPGLPPPMPSGLGRDFTSNMIGFGLVLLASTGICISLNMQKLVHMRNTDAQTGQAVVNFVTLPMWWAATLLNVVAEVFNLLALGYAPATLVTPLGCLTVVFNAIASRVLLGEPFFRRDALGILAIFIGVICVVWSQARELQAQLENQPTPLEPPPLDSGRHSRANTFPPPPEPCSATQPNRGCAHQPLSCDHHRVPPHPQARAPSPPITPTMLRETVLPSLGFWILIGGVFFGLLVLYLCAHPRLQLDLQPEPDSSMARAHLLDGCRLHALHLPPSQVRT